MSTALTSSLDASAPARPTWPSAFLFRFAFIYWVVFCIPVIATQIFGLAWIGEAVVPACDAMVSWLGKLVFGITSELSIADNGSGDRAGWWVYLFGAASLALVGAFAWSFVDRRRARDAQLRAMLRVLVRYTLSFAMLVFGVLKLFVLQFPAPRTSTLLERYGDASPMGLLWTFMGASPAYVFFSGAAETLGAVLLWSRRTTTLGALVLTGVLTNVVLLNFCYDVPVKIHSTHYLAMCVFLILPELGRLAAVLVLDRGTQPRARAPLLANRRLRLAMRVVKYGAITALLALNIKSVLEQREMYRPYLKPSAWYDSTWNVTTFTRDGVDVPPVITDATRWRRLVLWKGPDQSYLRIRSMDEAGGARYTLVVDEQTHTLTAALPEDNTEQPQAPIVLHYTRADADHLTLDGKLGGARLAVTLERFDPRELLLVRRGFHWISEQPFNR